MCVRVRVRVRVCGGWARVRVPPIAEWLGGFLVTCSWRSGAITERDERTRSQAGVLIILLHRKGGSELKVFSDRLPERMVLEAKPG